MGPQCVKQNFAEALVRNALMAGRAGLNGGVEMISDISDWKDFKSFDANGRVPVAMEKLLWPGIEIREIRADRFTKGGQIESPCMDCRFPFKSIWNQWVCRDVLIWWLPATDEDKIHFFWMMLWLLQRWKMLRTIRSVVFWLFLQSLGTRTNVCVQREGNNDLPVEATVSWSVEATVSWWVSRNTAPSFRCWCGNAQSWAPKVCLQAAGIKTGNQTENPYKSRLSVHWKVLQRMFCAVVSDDRDMNTLFV